MTDFIDASGGFVPFYGAVKWGADKLFGFGVIGGNDSGVVVGTSLDITGFVKKIPKGIKQGLGIASYVMNGYSLYQSSSYSDYALDEAIEYFFDGSMTSTSLNELTQKYNYAKKEINKLMQSGKLVYQISDTYNSRLRVEYNNDDISKIRNGIKKFN